MKANPKSLVLAAAFSFAASGAMGGEYAAKVTTVEAVEVSAVQGGRLTFAERRAGRVGARSARRGSAASCSSASASAKTVEVTEVPAVIRTESVYETRKVGQKTVIAPATAPASKVVPSGIKAGAAK